ncbi:hypothetical protein ACFUN8_06460 [Streptomyces sp. NPDC057307]|uniref:hypothetical protein n=1 Tax=Streptomyces sp. NPDC057307 TaxID=3346096 RepID=UPI00363919FB
MTVPPATPYVAARSTDKGPRKAELSVEFTAKGPRLAYKHPRPGDRDSHGNLWIRMEEPTEPGRILYDSMHPARQRTCMERMLCQICAGPADRDRHGWLFIDWRREDSPPTWPERSITSMPPLCTAHVQLSLRQCPFLRRTEHAVLRVRKPHLYGASGTLYRLTDHGWLASENDALFPYSKPRHPGLLASRLHRELRGVTVTDLA